MSGMLLRSRLLNKRSKLEVRGAVRADGRNRIVGTSGAGPWPSAVRPACYTEFPKCTRKPIASSSNVFELPPSRNMDYTGVEWQSPPIYLVKREP